MTKSSFREPATLGMNEGTVTVTELCEADRKRLLYTCTALDKTRGARLPSRPVNAPPQHTRPSTKRRRPAAAQRCIDKTMERPPAVAEGRGAHT